MLLLLNPLTPDWLT